MVILSLNKTNLDSSGDSKLVLFDSSFLTDNCCKKAESFYLIIKSDLVRQIAALP